MRRLLSSLAALTLLASTAACVPSPGDGPENGGGEKTSPDRLDLPVPDVKPEGFVDALPDMAAYQGQELKWEDCDGYTCATVTVPLNWDEPGKQGITLSMKRKAATQEPKLGTIFVNPGGPGGSGKDLVGHFQARGLEQYDIVGWDPRGVGDSTPVQCMQGKELEENYLSVDNAQETEEGRKAAEEKIKKFTTSCLEKSGPLLQHISTQDTVKDLDLLRHLVGDEKLNFFGFSYGTQVGSYYAEMFPENVGHMGLDGAVNITEREDIVQMVGFDRALQNYAKKCSADKSCSDLGDSEEKVIKTITDYLHGLKDKPVKVDDRELNQPLGLIGVIITLYSEDTWEYLTIAMTQAINGDGSMLLALADAYYQRGPDGNYGTMTTSFPAIRCLDEADDGLAGAYKQGEEDAKKAPIFGQFGGADIMCPLWPVKPVKPLDKIKGEGAAPILIIGSTGDSATPYEYAQDMAKALDSGHLITLEGEGHGAYGTGSKCLDEMVVNYFVKDEVPEEGATCQRQ